MVDKWIKRWEVPKSSGEGVWIVALDKQGNYGCSCPLWKFRREECHHILQVKNNGGEQVKNLTEEERAELKLKAYAEKGYRYYTWYNEPLFSHERQSLEDLKNWKLIDDVKTFARKGIYRTQRVVLIKENPLAYENEFTNFVKLLKSCNFRKRFSRNPLRSGIWSSDYWVSQKELRKELRQRWFDITQHIIYNKTGIINSNLPKGSVYNNGEWGKRIVNLQRHFRFLK